MVTKEHDGTPLGSRESGTTFRKVWGCTCRACAQYCIGTASANIAWGTTEEQAVDALLGPAWVNDYPLDFRVMVLDGIAQLRDVIEQAKKSGDVSEIMNAILRQQ